MATGTRVRPANYPRQVFTWGDVKTLDAKAGRVHAIVSTERKDRAGDIIRQDGWNLDDFLKHPALLVNHDYRSVRSQVGEWEEMKVKEKALHGVARYYVGEGNENADWAFNLASKGRAAFSVGFIPDMDKAVLQEGGDEWFGPWEFNGQELLEVSQVTIPANPEALQMLKTLGLLTLADIRQLIVPGDLLIPKGHLTTDVETSPTWKDNPLQEAISRW